MIIARLLLLSLLVYPILSQAEKAKSPQSSSSNKSVLRVTCDEVSQGADISLNGKFKGQCPIDISVTEGEFKLVAKKNINESYIGNFEQNIRIGEGVVQRVEVVLNKQLTEIGRAFADEKKQKIKIANEQLRLTYEAQLTIFNEAVNKCAATSAAQAKSKGDACWNGGGCATFEGDVLNFFGCETYKERKARCYGNPDEKDYDKECEMKLVNQKPNVPTYQAEE